MALASVFSPAFKHSLVSKSALSSSSNLSTKRKRGSGDLESQSSDNKSEAGKTADSILTLPNFQPLASGSFITDEHDTDQFRSARQPFDRSLLKQNFPHAPSALTTETSRVPSDQLEYDLTTLKPPLSIPGGYSWKGPSISGFSGGEGFRRRHLAALTTVLHKCMSEGDYLRAGRAWAIIIRFEINGHSLDIRNDDRWGTGAEILYHRSEMLDDESRENETSASRLDEYENNESNENISKLKRLHCKGGFQEAQDYYERLALQYPYQKVLSNAVSALDFWPASYALWVWSLHDQYERSSKSAEAVSLNFKSDVDEMTKSNKTTSLAYPISQQYPGMVDVGSFSFRRGNEIAERLDELLGSPPHSDDPRLWSIRGMVALWIADLLTTPMPQRAGISSLIEEDEQSIEQNCDVMWKGAGGSLRKTTYNGGFQEHHSALEKAKMAFGKISRLRDHTPAYVDC